MPHQLLEFADDGAFCPAPTRAHFLCIILCISTSLTQFLARIERVKVAHLHFPAEQFLALLLLIHLSLVITMTVLCHHCLCPDMDSQPAGRNIQFPWMLSHECSRCSKITFTCNGTCVTLHKKRKGSDSYADIRQVRQHHKSCHKGLDKVLPTVEECEEVEFMDCSLDDSSSILPSEEFSPSQPFLAWCNQDDVCWHKNLS